MTTTRFAFTRRASQLVWLLPLGLAGLATACGSSPSMIGMSAGAAGASAGNAGSSSETGGSGSGQAGAGATTSGGSSELGGASTGGATSSGGASTGGATSSGGASTGGATSSGGASTGGSTSGGAAGSGGSGVGACSADKDCAAGYDCLYKMADGCTAKGSCFKMPTGALCASLSSYCGCSGQMVGVPCYDPTGYSPAPVSSQQSSATCPATPTPDAACVGKVCGAGCGTGEVPSVCDASGKCIPGGAPSCM